MARHKPPDKPVKPVKRPIKPAAHPTQEQEIHLDSDRWSGFRDTFGEREVGIDPDGNPIELLRLIKEFSPFEQELADRVAALKSYDRPAVARPTRVEQDDQKRRPRVVLVSDRIPGLRLSELLTRGVGRSVVPDIGAALFVMRRLFAAAESLRISTGVSHFVLAPERVVITPRAEVVIVEAALAGAVEALVASHSWPKVLRLANGNGDGQKDGHRLDIARIARIGIAMMLGRSLDAGETVDALSPVLGEIADVGAIRAGDAFSAAFGVWLEHAVTIDADVSFANFKDAGLALGHIATPKDCAASRATLQNFLNDLDLDDFSNADTVLAEADRIRAIRERQTAARPVSRSRVAWESVAKELGLPHQDEVLQESPDEIAAKPKSFLGSVARQFGFVIKPEPVVAPPAVVEPPEPEPEAAWQAESPVIEDQPASAWQAPAEIVYEPEEIPLSAAEPEDISLPAVEIVEDPMLIDGITDESGAIDLSASVAEFAEESDVIDLSSIVLSGPERFHEPAPTVVPTPPAEGRHEYGRYVFDALPAPVVAEAPEPVEEVPEVQEEIEVAEVAAPISETIEAPVFEILEDEPFAPHGPEEPIVEDLPVPEPEAEHVEVEVPKKKKKSWFRFGRREVEKEEPTPAPEPVEVEPAQAPEYDEAAIAQPVEQPEVFEPAAEVFAEPIAAAPTFETPAIPPPPAWTPPPIVKPDPPVWTPPPVVKPEPRVWTPPPIVKPEPPVWTPPPVVKPEPPVWTPPPIVKPEPPVWTPPPVVKPEPPVWTPPPIVKPELPVWTPPPIVKPEPPAWTPPPIVKPEPPAWTPPVDKPAPPPPIWTAAEAVIAASTQAVVQEAPPEIIEQEEEFEDEPTETSPPEVRSTWIKSVADELGLKQPSQLDEAPAPPPVPVPPPPSAASWQAPTPPATPAWQVRPSAPAEPAAPAWQPAPSQPAPARPPASTWQAQPPTAPPISAAPSNWQPPVSPRISAAPANWQPPPPEPGSSAASAWHEPAAVTRTAKKQASGSPQSTGGATRLMGSAALLVLSLGLVGGLAWYGRSYYQQKTAPGTVVIESNPRGAEIFVDGASKGVTPLTLELPAGAHELELRRRGGSRKLTVQIAAGEQLKQQIDLTNLRAAGTLVVNSSPKGARVILDGKALGVTPITVQDVAVGAHKVSIEAGSGTVTKDVQVQAGGTTNVDEGIFSGWIAVFAPFELQIFERRKLIGTTENERIMLSPGRHELELVNEQLGFRESRAVDVKPGDTVAVNVSSAEGTLRITTPAGSEVFIDGASVGQSPLEELKVPVGTREIVVKHATLGEKKVTVRVGSEKPAEVTVAFDQP